MKLRHQILVCVLPLMSSVALASPSGASVQGTELSPLRGEKNSAAAVSPSSAPYTAATPEGKVLPQGVARARVLQRSYTGTSGFDGEGKPLELGLTRSTGLSAGVGEFGLTNSLSLQILVPVIYQNQLNLDQEKFQKSSVYSQKYNQIADGIAAKLVAARLCKDLGACRQMLDERHLHAPFDMELPLPTGEKLAISSAEPLKDQIDTFLLQAATPPLNGVTGLGDVEAGLLFNAYASQSLLLSTAVGLRLPTGEFAVPEMLRPTSGGVYDLGWRANLDASPVFGLWLSWQPKVEYALSKATWNRPSMLENTLFNEADSSISNGGDGLANRQVYSKEGLHYENLFKVNYGLAALSPELKALAVNTFYNFKRERAVFLNGSEYTPASQLQSVGVGSVVSGLGYRVPVELELSYSIPVAGKNQKVAVSQADTQLKVYARF